jgi:hypothetical protein
MDLCDTAAFILKLKQEIILIAASTNTGHGNSKNGVAGTQLSFQLQFKRTLMTSIINRTERSRPFHHGALH